MAASGSSFSDSKQHFLTLDALRGVASVMVVFMHIFEVYCKGDFHKLIINHGYLAVDFFFMLSGYVMAHAYDDRWDTMTVWDFFKRRLIRLHPLIVLGMTIGALLFYFQAAPMFPNIAGTPVWKMLAIMAIGYTLLPVPVSMDIRGWTEMHPLNGAAWSLFFEYIANVLHVLILRKLPNLILGALVILAALALFHLAVYGPAGDIIGGWSLEPQQLKMGFTRLLFPYMAGMLLRRAVKLGGGQKTFLLSCVLLVGALCVPRIGGYDHNWQNGLYEALVIIFLFPLIIYLGAVGEVKGARAQKVCAFLGDVSYPLYITHFPFIYVYYAWVQNNNITLEQGIWVVLPLATFVVIVAYIAFKYYDLPVRKWLAARFMPTKK